MKAKNAIVLSIAVAGVSGILLFKFRILDSGSPQTPTQLVGEHPSQPQGDAQHHKIVALPPHNPTARIHKPVIIPVVSPLQRAIGELGSGNLSWAGFARRIGGVHELGNNLDQGDVLAVMDFVENGTDQHIPHDLRMGVVNEIMDLLLDQESLPDGVGNWLLSLAQNKSMGHVTRDYAIQHLVPYVERAFIQDGSIANNSDWATFHKEFMALSNDPTTLGATALLGLSYLAVNYKGMDTVPVIKRAKETASSADIDPTVRVTAVQVLARFGDRGSLSVIRSLASGNPCSSAQSAVQSQSSRVDGGLGDASLPPEKISMHLQMSAISALGSVGEAQDIVFIKSLTNGAGVAGVDPRVIPAAQSALSRLESHLAGS